MSKTSLTLTGIILIAFGIILALSSQVSKIKKERDIYRSNSDALLSECDTLRIDSANMALDNRTLQLSVDEFKKYRAEDAETIKKLNIKLSRVKSVSTQQLEVNVPIKAEIKDSITTISKDSVAKERYFKMESQYIKLAGVIRDSVVVGDIKIPVTINQVVYLDYKWKFLWWKKIRGVRQIVNVNNPYVTITYSEFIEITK